LASAALIALTVAASTTPVAGMLKSVCSAFRTAAVPGPKTRLLEAGDVVALEAEREASCEDF
jgi:hypothetical protein